MNLTVIQNAPSSLSITEIERGTVAIVEKASESVAIVEKATEVVQVILSRGLKGDPASILDIYGQASSRSGLDDNGVYTIVEYRRADNTLVRRSVLSGGVSPEYSTRTEQIYAQDGVTVENTMIFNLTYINGDFISEDLV